MKVKSWSSEISRIPKTSRHYVLQWDDSNSSHVSQPDGVGYLSFFRGPTLCVLMRKMSVLFLSKAVLLLENQGNVKDVRISIQTKRALKKNKQFRQKRNLKLALWKRKMTHPVYVDRQAHGSGIIWILTLSHRHSEEPLAGTMNWSLFPSLKENSWPTSPSVLHLSQSSAPAMQWPVCCETISPLKFAVRLHVTQPMTYHSAVMRPGGNCCPRGNMKRMERKWQRA